MTFGMTSTGFNRKRLADIKTDIETALKAVFGENIDLEPQSVFGQFVGLMAEGFADQWESQENVYNSQYPDTASDNQLSNVVKLNGLTRLAATKATVTATLSGISGTLVPLGSEMSTSDTGTVFVTLAGATIGGGGTIDVETESKEAGFFEAAAGTLTIIDTPVYGWTGVTNASDAIAGRAEETDTALRLRQSESTEQAGQNSADALSAQLKNLSGVVDALVFENKTNVVDALGIPPHEFECFVKGGTGTEIADTIWINTPVGIQSHGDILVVVEDAQGFDQNVYYSVPSDVNIYVKADITVDSSFPASGSDDIKSSVVDYGEANFLISDDVIYSQLFGPIHETTGVLSITLTIGLAPSPSGTSNITIDPNEISAWDISRVEVNIV